MKSKLTVSVVKNFLSFFSAFFIIFSASSLSSQERGSVLLGYVIIPDIITTTERLGKLAETIEPGQSRKDFLKTKAGAFLGDPELANIKREMPVVIMLFQNTDLDKLEGSSMNHMEYAVIIPVKDKKSYVESLTRMNIPYETNDDRIIISNKKSSLFFAQREMGFYRTLSREKYNCDFRAVAKIESFLSVHNSSIEAGLKMLQTITSMNAFAGGSNVDETQIAIGKFFIYGLLELAMQSTGYQLDVSLNRDAVDLYSEFTAKAGTPLSSYFDGEPQTGNRCLSLLPERGQLSYAGYMDTKRLRELVESLISLSIKREPSLEKHLNRDLVNAFLDYTKLYLGEFAVSYGFNSSGRLEVDAAAATGSSGAEHIEANDRFMGIYNEVIKKYGEVSGFSGYTMQRNYRMSSGVDVHRYVMNLATSKMSDAEKVMMEKMFGKEFSMEFAVSNGYIAASTSPENLDRIIAATISPSAGAELISMKAFGPGMDSYIDMDIPGFIERIIETGSSEKDLNDPALGSLKAMLKMLNAEERNILFSTKYSKGVSYSRCRISTRMITEFIKAAKDQGKQEPASGESEDYESFEESGE